MQKILKILNLLIKSKLSFLPPKKKGILLFDYDGDDVASKILEKNSYEILHTRKEKLNILIILITVLKGEINFIAYHKQFIKWVSPKIVITFNDNYLSFYELKKYFDCHFIAVQRGYRTYHNDILEIFKKENKKYFIDKYFVFNKSIANHLKNYVSSDYILLGSPRNNFNLKKSKKKNREILYISSFAPLGFAKLKESNEFISNFYSKEIEVLHALIKYSAKINYKFLLLAKHSKKENKELEKNYFLKNLKGDFDYLENSQTRDVYEIMDNAALSIGTHSTLLYENLSRENKCFVFNFRHEKYPFNTKRFGYFSNLPTSGEIWYQGTDIDFFLKKIEFLLNCSDNEWKTILNRYSDETCYYNYENTILKNYLNDYLSNKNL